MSRPLARRPGLASGIDALVAVLITAIVLLQVLPFGYSAVGAPALVALALGALAPLGGEQVPGGDGVVLLLATVGLGLHGFLDGTALVEHDDSGFGEAVAHGIILHSLPFGLGVWRSLAGRGAGLGWAVLAAVAAGELAGYAVGASLPTGWAAALGALQCFVAGSLLHLLGHAASRTDYPRASGMGALLGVLGAVALWVDEPPPHLTDQTAATVLWHLAAAQAPAALVAWLALTMLSQSSGPMRGRRIASAVAVATTLWLVGVGFALAVAPVLALAERFTAAPRGPSGTSAPGAGSHEPAALDHADHGHSHAHHGHAHHGHARHDHAHPGDAHPAPPPHPPDAPPADAPVDSTNPAVVSFARILDRSLPALIGATLLAAVLGPLLPAGALAAVGPSAQVIIAALLGVPLYISPVAVVPLLAVLGPSGLTGGAAIAFLLTGPASNLPSLLRDVRARGIVAGLTRPTLLLLASIGGGLAWNAAGVDAWLWPAGWTPAGAPSFFENLALAVVTALAIEALLRRGLSGFLEPLLHPHAHPVHPR